jgi:hypothetical protein
MLIYVDEYVYLTIATVEFHNFFSRQNKTGKTRSKIFHCFLLRHLLLYRVCILLLFNDVKLEKLRSQVYSSPIKLLIYSTTTLALEVYLTCQKS